MAVPEIGDAMEFDFVVIGAGSSGCALTERLSADGRHSIAVVEAGGTDRRLWVQIPLGYGRTFYDPSLTWGYRADPDPGLGGQADYWPRGKLLGGCSSINAMVWIRGDPRDYDDWAAEGNTGWAYADILPLFRALEHNEAGGDEWRGQGGAMHVADVSARLHPLARRFIAAGIEAGLSFNADFNGAATDGVGVYQITVRNGRRMSAARAFLRPAMARRNVRVLGGAHAMRIIFENRRATGVEIMRHGRALTIRARREVILAAGAVNSPQVLHLSGIGPGAHLREIGVTPLHDLPAIGAHLQDHVGINYTYRARIPSLNQTLRPWWGKLLAGVDFLARGRGPLSLSLNQGGGFLRTRPGLDRPNIQLYLQAITTLTARKGARPLLTPDPFPGFSLGLSNCHPASRGAVMARSADPFMAPRITPNALSDARDVQDMLEGVRFLRTLAAQPSLREIIDAELAPGPGVTDDEGMIADLRARCGTVYHPCGTCRMGSDPRRSAVDARLRVHGLDGLRVADASVFPSVVCGNINAAAIMVGAKAAAMILEDAR